MGLSPEFKWLNLIIYCTWLYYTLCYTLYYTLYLLREHPELSVGMQTEGIDVRSVGNSLTLHETALVEAFNLKAAIEYQLKNFEGAQEALTDMPPRSEEELDCVTLHNQVGVSVSSDSVFYQVVQSMILYIRFVVGTFKIRFLKMKIQSHLRL